MESRKEDENHMDLGMLVIVDKPSQKGILIGKQAKMIRSIRLASQKELSEKFHKKVHLDLYVRVEKNWRNQHEKIKEFGLDELDDND